MSPLSIDPIAGPFFQETKNKEEDGEKVRGVLPAEVHHSIFEAARKKQLFYDPNETSIFATSLTVEIAKVSITDEGKVNLSKINEILKNCFKENEPGFLCSIKKNLLCLHDSSDLQMLLESIRPPHSPAMPSSIIIAAILQLSPETPIYPADARRAALTALLTHPRQEQNGSCFATPLMIQLLLDNPHKSLLDLKSLLETSKLTRIVEGAIKDIPFLLSFNDVKLCQTVTEKDKELLLKHPGFLSACKMLGVANPQDALDKELKGSMRIKDLLERLSPTGRMHALLAFEAESCNPLVRVWENVIASMAEQEETGMIKEALISSLMHVLHRKARENPTLEKIKRRRYLSKIQDIVLVRIHFWWDPGTAKIDAASDQRSIWGAFVLYDKGGKLNPSTWKRIDTPESFISFLREIIVENPEEAISSSLFDYIEKPLFLQTLLLQYYKPYENVSELLQKLDQIPYTPWINRGGNSFNRVLKVYWEKETLKTLKTRPKSAEALLQFIQNLQEKNRKPRLIPARVLGVHAFCLIIRDSFIHEVPEITMPAFTPELLKECLDFIHQISQQAIKENEVGYQSLAEFRQTIKSHFEQMNLSSHALAKFDSFLFSKVCLIGSVFPFADSNWSEGLMDLQFCFYRHPFTHDIELGIIREDGNNLTALVQKDWIEGKTWEIYEELVN